jgi:hypothetical protein
VALAVRRQSVRLTAVAAAARLTVTAAVDSAVTKAGERRSGALAALCNSL